MIGKPGFSLIELLIALAISGFVSMMLYTFLNQTQRVVKRVDTTVEQATLLTVLYHQLEKDLTGVFVPLVYGDQQKKDTPEKKQEDPIFMLVSEEDKKLKNFSCITANPLSIYERFTPRIVRVRYSLKQDERHEGLYLLVRQESTDLALKKIEDADVAVRGYTIAHSLKYFSVAFIVADQGKPQDASTKKEWKVETKWPLSAHTQGDKKPEQLVPEYIEVKGILWDERTQYAQEFTFLYALPAYGGASKKTAPVLPVGQLSAVPIVGASQ